MNEDIENGPVAPGAQRAGDPQSVAADKSRSGTGGRGNARKDSEGVPQPLRDESMGFSGGGRASSGSGSAKNPGDRRER